MKKIIAITSLAAILLAVSPTFALEGIADEPDNHLSQVETEIHAVLGINNLGAGIRINFPVLKQGFINDLNNSVAINLGADFLNWTASDYNVTGVVVPVMLQWNFYLTRDWSLFAEGGVAFQNWFSRRASGDDQTFFFWPGMSLGGRYYLNSANYPALVMRIGYPSGLTLGISF